MIDLHTHSTASDGQYSPAELMRLAKKNGVTVMALTDHDTVSGIEEAQSEVERIGLKFFPGIEISTDSEFGSMHILGYNIDPKNTKLSETCKWFVEQRRERGEKIFRFLEERGVPLTRESVEKYSNGGLLIRPHFARAMVDAGYVHNTREAFDKHLDVPEFKKIKREKLTPEKSLELILGARGIPVLAHPVQIKTDLDGLSGLVKKLSGLGLMGMECYYSTHTPEQTEEYLKIARANGLYVTAGSDFHGEKIKPDIKLGSGINNSLCIEDLEIIKLLEKRT